MVTMSAAETHALVAATHLATTARLALRELKRTGRDLAARGDTHAVAELIASTDLRKLSDDSISPNRTMRADLDIPPDDRFSHGRTRSDLNTGPQHGAIDDRARTDYAVWPDAGWSDETGGRINLSSGTNDDGTDRLTGADW